MINNSNNMKIKKFNESESNSILGLNEIISDLKGDARLKDCDIHGNLFNNFWLLRIYYGRDYTIKQVLEIQKIISDKLVYLSEFYDIHSSEFQVYFKGSKEYEFAADIILK